LEFFILSHKNNRVVNTLEKYFGEIRYSSPHEVAGSTMDTGPNRVVWQMEVRKAETLKVSQQRIICRLAVARDGSGAKDRKESSIE
jgi:hypothetical protein